VAASQVLHLITLIVCGLIFVPPFGAFGAALAWLAGNLIGIPVLVFLVNRYVLKFRTVTMLRESLLRPVVVASITLLIAYLIKPMVHGWLTLGLACGVVTVLLVCKAVITAVRPSQTAANPVPRDVPPATRT